MSSPSSALRAPALRGEYAPKPPARTRFGQAFLTPLRGAVDEAAEIGTFTGRTILELRGVWRYSSEILRSSKGNPLNVTAAQRDELKAIAGKFDLKRAGQDLVPHFMRHARRRGRR